MILFRKVRPDDASLLFEWANDELVRKASHNPDKITWENHLTWFNKQLSLPLTSILIYYSEYEEKPLGTVRIWESGNETVIGIQMGPASRGKGYSSEMLRISSEFYIKLHPGTSVIAYVKRDNVASYKMCLNAGFKDVRTVNVNGVENYWMLKQ